MASAPQLRPGRHVLLAFAKSPKVGPTAELFADRDTVLEALPKSEDRAVELCGAYAG